MLPSTFASRSSKNRQISRISRESASRSSKNRQISRISRESVVFSSGGARGGETKSDLKAGQGWPRLAKAGQGWPRPAKAGQGPFAPKAETVVNFCFPKLQNSSNLKKSRTYFENFVKSHEISRISSRINSLFFGGSSRGGKSKSYLKAGEGRRSDGEAMAKRWRRPFCSKS